MAKKAYTLNTEKKTITIDDSVKLTAAEEKDVALYVNAGYIIRHKSKKKSEKATERAKGNMSNEEILKALENDKEGLKKYFIIFFYPKKHSIHVALRCISDFIYIFKRIKKQCD